MFKKLSEFAAVPIFRLLLLIRRTVGLEITKKNIEQKTTNKNNKNKNNTAKQI